MLLSHGGGFLPCAAYRFAGLTSTVLDPDRKTEDNHYLETYLDHTPGQAEAIDRGNAEVLFPRLARWPSRTALLAHEELRGACAYTPGATFPWRGP